MVSNVKFIYFIFLSLPLYAFDIQSVDETNTGKSIKKDIEDNLKKLQLKYGENILKLAENGKPIYKSVNFIVKPNNNVINSVNHIVNNKITIIKSSDKIIRGVLVNEK